MGDIPTSWLYKIREALQSMSEEEIKDGDNLQRFLFAMGKDVTPDQKKWFEFLYSALLHKKSGPKLGPFLAVLGKEESLKLFDKACAIHQ